MKRDSIRTALATFFAITTIVAAVLLAWERLEGSGLVGVLYFVAALTISAIANGAALLVVLVASGLHRD